MLLLHNVQFFSVFAAWSGHPLADLYESGVKTLKAKKIWMPVLTQGIHQRTVNRVVALVKRSRDRRHGL